MAHPKLHVEVVDFDHLPEAPGIYKCDDLFVAFGTTIANARTKERFQQVDLELPTIIAQRAHAAGCSQAMVISAIGADASSRIFYSRMKGLLEDNLRKLDFKAIHLFQPGVLLGHRQESRPGEAIAAFFSRLADRLKPGLFGKYSGMPVETLAAAMVAAAIADNSGVHVHTWRSIIQLAKQPL